MNKRRKNNYIILGLCAVLVLMGIGYAAFSSQLNITGTSNITSTWDVRITNIESELNGATDVSEPTYDNTNGMYASFHTGLSKPGDYALYTVTIENRWDIDARIEKINSYYQENEYVTFTLSGLSKGDVIEGHQSKELQVRVEFNNNVTSIDGDIDINFDVSIDVAQDSDNPLPTDDYYLTYDYETNGGTSGDDNNGFVNGETTLTGKAYREGYEFVGWNTDKNAHEGIEKVTVSENTTVYAIFRKVLNVTYNKVEGVESLEKESDSCYIYNNETNCNITLPNITPVKGYELEGFSETDGGEVIGTSGEQIAISEDKTYYPKVKGETSVPTLVLNPNKQDSYTDGTAVTVSITDNGAGLKANQNIYYAWSTSNTEAPSFTEYVTTTNNEGVESTEVTIPESSATILTGTYYLWIKEGIEDALGNTSIAKVSEGFNFDNETPSLSVSTNKTTNSIQVVATANALSGIAKYEYSNNGGSTWIDGSNSYTFTGLTHNTNYNIQVRVTSTTGKQTTSEITSVTTSVLNVPTFSEVETDNGKTVTITYPEGEGLTYDYQKDSGSWTSATQRQQVEFTESGTLVARVTDGTNTETATYAVEVKQDSAGSDLVDQAGVVTSGDGLYKDSYESNVYTYRGANPNNYVTFNGESWRIISANTSDNTIKIMRNAVLSDRQFDISIGRYQGSSRYCNDSSGCNIWGSSSTLYDSNLSPITELAREVNRTKYALPSQEAELNTYLNGEYYNGISAEARSMIKSDAIYKVGVLKYQSGQTISTDIIQVNAVKWKGKVALIDATEYVRASTYSSCTDVDYAYSNTGCKNNNWMYLNDIWWTLLPNSYGSSYAVWCVNSSGGLHYNYASYAHGVRPVLTLASNVQITGGAGTSSSPYTLGVW